jgi:hypothetical protein
MAGRMDRSRAVEGLEGHTKEPLERVKLVNDVIGFTCKKYLRVFTPISWMGNRTCFFLFFFLISPHFIL